MQRTAEETGWPHAIVAYADFSADDVRPQLDRLSRYPLLRGARMQLHWHENPLYRFAARADLCADPRIRRNVGASRRLWLELRPAGVRAANGGRGGPCGSPARRSPSCCSTPACWRTFRPPDARSGAPAWCAWPPARTWSPSFPGSAPSFIATIPRMSPTSSARRVGDLRRRSLPVRIELSDREAVDLLWRDLVEAYRDAVSRSHTEEQQAILHDTAMSVYRHRALSGAHNETRKIGRRTCRWKSRFWTMATSSWNRASLCSAAIAGARAACRRSGFLILGGAYPIVVDTGYRSNQIMETLGMRGPAVPREHDREPALQAWRAHGRRPLRLPHPSAHRSRRQG